VKTQTTATKQVYNLAGQRVSGQGRGLTIVKNGAEVRKVVTNK
jgi:hypothetical protein